MFKIARICQSIWNEEIIVYFKIIMSKWMRNDRVYSMYKYMYLYINE